MNKYEVLSNGCYITVEVDHHELTETDMLGFLILEENGFGKACALFKDWTYFRKIKI